MTVGDTAFNMDAPGNLGAASQTEEDSSDEDREVGSQSPLKAMDPLGGGGVEDGFSDDSSVDGFDDEGDRLESDAGNNPMVER